jgi:thiol-disulfide isomerase/thioredoxin
MQKNLFSIGLLLLLANWAYAAKDSMTMRGDVDYLKEGDEVLITIHKYGPGSEAPLVTERKIKSKGHTFESRLPVFTEMESIDISFPKYQKYYSNYFVRPNDCILLCDKGGVVSFSGEGALRYRVQYTLYSIYHYYAENSLLLKENLQTKFSTRLRLLELGKMKCLEYLEKEKANLSARDFLLLKAEIVIRSEIQSRSAIHYHIIYSDSFKSVVVPIVEEYRKSIRQFDFSQDQVLNQFSVASSYPNYILLSYRVDSSELMNKPFNAKACYQYVATHFNGILRERLITQLVFTTRNQKNQDFDYMLTDGSHYVKQPYLKEMLVHLKETRLAGKTAYNFSLSDIQGQKRQLVDFRGKVVLLNFWFIGCGFCREIHPFLDSIREVYKDKPFELVSICTDKDREMWKQSIAGNQYTSIENVNLTTEGFDNPLIKYYNITSYPTLLLIDKNGKICSAVSDPRGDNARSLISQIERELNK